MSVTSIGAETLIVACAGAHHPEQGNQSAIYVGVYNVNDIDMTHLRWKPQSSVWRQAGDFAALPGEGYAATGVGTRVSIDWFNGPDGPAAQWPLFPTLLWVSVGLVWNGPGPGGTSFLLGLDGKLSVQPYGGSAGPTLHNTKTDTVSVAVRDPAGRIRAYSSNSSLKSLEISTYSTYSVDDFAPTELFASGSTTLEIAANVDALPPSVVFYAPTDTSSPVTLNQQSGSEYPVYEFVFYNGSEVRCQVSRYGTAQSFPSYATFQPSQPIGITDMIIPAGIIDPLPIPEANIADVDLVNDDFGVLTYAYTKETSGEHTVSNSWSLGFKSTASSDKGWGPAWDISMSGGMGFVSQKSTEKVQTSSHPYHTKLDPDSVRPNQKLVNAGGVFGCEAVIHVDAYRFLDAGGSPICDGTDGTVTQQAPLFWTTSALFPDLGASEYLPYAVTTGDITSYTPEALHERMSSSHGFKGSNYFTEVIEKFAYKFPDGNCYMEASWAGDANIAPEMGITTSGFTEQSWTLDSSVYGGVSGGEGAEFFGFGEDWAFTLLFGGTYTHDVDSTTSSGETWGIQLDGDFGPPATRVGKAISSYDFRIYFLPPPSEDPSYWTRELKSCIGDGPSGYLTPDMIDPNAGAWRIMYVVTHYAYTDGSPGYTYVPPPS